MQETLVPTDLADIAVGIHARGEADPLVFLHGIFLDRSLWTACASDHTDRTHICVDMPAHGKSGNVGRDWSLDECVPMLIDILDALEVEKCIAVGHSWGSMTALRAAAAFPHRFSGLCLFNMPFRAQTRLGRFGFSLQKRMTGFQRFYGKQAAKSLYSKARLELQPELSAQMQGRLVCRPAKEISRVIDAVILGAGDATQMIANLTVPAIAVVGESDYVGIPPLQTITVPGGHISPQEAPEQTRVAIARAVGLVDAGLSVSAPSDTRT